MIGEFLTTNNPKDKEVAKSGTEHYEGEGQGPEHVQKGPWGGGVDSPETCKILSIRGATLLYKHLSVCVTMAIYRLAYTESPYIEVFEKNPAEKIIDWPI